MRVGVWRGRGAKGGEGGGAGESPPVSQAFQSGAGGESRNRSLVSRDSGTGEAGFKHDVGWQFHA